jgi:FkbM family methyltransferase
MEPDINKFTQYQQAAKHFQKSQLGQDLFVCFILNEKSNGYFIDFGATDGIEKSNSYILEKQFNWNGIVCEPAKPYHIDLDKNRSCIKDFRCVYKTTGEIIKFRDCDARELSCIDDYTNNDSWAWNRVMASVYDVETVSLNDLLNQNNAPKTIDYLSVDTEGSEFDILSAFNFDQYHINIITAEHNHTPNKNKMIELLESHNFIHVFDNVTDFDSWFINKSIL